MPLVKVARGALSALAANGRRETRCERALTIGQVTPHILGLPPVLELFMAQRIAFIGQRGGNAVINRQNMLYHLRNQPGLFSAAGLRKKSLHRQPPVALARQGLVPLSLLRQRTNLFGHKQ